MRFNSPAIPRTDYQGAKQAGRILRAARTVFVRDGAAVFSARSVAREAGLSLGSVQHVFPTIAALMTGMLEHVITGYDLAYRKMVAQLPFSGDARLKAALDVLLRDICRQDTRRFF